MAIFLLVVAFIGCLVNQYRFYSDESVMTSTQVLDEKIAYLTFDDGPSEVTEVMLDTLKEEEVTATFFVIGQQITKETEPVLLRMVEDGHTIGIHTYTHNSKEIYKSADAYVADALKTAERIEEVTGKKPDFYRFPWGSVNSYVRKICDEIVAKMEEKGYVYYDWNVSAEDSVGNPTKTSILKNIRKDYYKYKEPVILMHDSRANRLSAEVLLDVIAELKSGGYRFDTIENRSKAFQWHKK